MAETAAYLHGPDSASGSLELTGYVRGNSICVNRLVHVPGLGDFQLNSIQKLADPAPILKRHGMDDLVELLPDEGQADLETENTPDGMDGEQTWPTEEEILEAEQQVKKKIKRVPKGTSDYQAAWILDESEDEEDEAENEESEDDEDMNDIEGIAAEEVEDSESEEKEIGRAHVELQSRSDLVCRLLLEKKKKNNKKKKKKKLKLKKTEIQNDEQV